LGFRNHQRAQPLRRDDERLYRLLRDRPHQRRTTRQLRQLPHEVARAVGDDRLLIVEMIAPGNVHRSGEDDHEAGSDLGDDPNRFTGCKGAEIAEPTYPLDLQRIEPGEYLIAALFKNGLQLQRHEGPPHATVWTRAPAMLRDAAPQAKRGGRVTRRGPRLR